jgi:hypothetical protein
MKRKALFTLILGTVLAVAPAAGAKVMSDGGAGTGTGPAATMTQPEYQALMIRSAALNKLYGNAITALTPQQFKSLYDAGLNRMTPQEQIATVARSEGMNRTYGGGTSNVTSPQQPSNATDGNSFAWNAAYGAIALTGAMLLALGLAVVSRRRHHHQPSF